MTHQQLVSKIFSNHNYLCVGLDTDRTKLPVHLQSHPDAVFEFNRQIIDATKDHCVAYKINTAFYEAEGLKGWEVMQRTVKHIPRTHFIIADAKRGDIGNTSAQYARAFFETLDFDAVTVAPYMGEDSIRPFLEYKDKWTILLALTSNPGSKDFEMKRFAAGQEGMRSAEHLYETVLRTAASWGGPEQLMFVAGATQATAFAIIRKLVPDHFLLVPGVGAQGGNLEEISGKGLTKNGGLLVNASRAVIYASGGEDFAVAAKRVAMEYGMEMKACLKRSLPG
jgi:orotidine-5'-phosphate decarboxylase